MKIYSRLGTVLSYESFGFLAIIALCWLNSLLGLPSLILEGHPQASDFESPMLQMLLILAVWLLVHASTRRRLEKLRQLENFLRVCSWCYHIECKGEWISLEKFFEQGFDTPTTHGICPECLGKQMAAVERAKQTRKLKQSGLQPAEASGTV